MIASNLPRHGGDLSSAIARFGRIPWLDLSTGINPWPYPVSEVGFEELSHLPTSDRQKTLCTTAARYYGAGLGTAVVVAPGTQALIQWLPYLTSRSGESLQVAVVAPTYAEHAAAWRAAGHRVVNIAPGDIATIEAEVVIVVNPNNPDGRVCQHKTLFKVARSLRLLVIDEAFADVQPDTSIVPLLCLPEHTDLTPKKIVVLRSFGKFFGLAGMRLGFALTGPALAARLETALGPWAVGGAALHIGTTALSDARWIAATRVRLRKAAIRLNAVLTEADLAVTGGTDLFRLADCGVACSAIYEGLGRAGILVRAFAHLPSQLRFGLPGREEEWQHLRKILLSLRSRSAAIRGWKKQISWPSVPAVP